MLHHLARIYVLGTFCKQWQGSVVAIVIYYSNYHFTIVQAMMLSWATLARTDPDPNMSVMVSYVVHLSHHYLASDQEIISIFELFKHWAQCRMTGWICINNLEQKRRKKKSAEISKKIYFILCFNTFWNSHNTKISNRFLRPEEPKSGVRKCFYANLPLISPKNVWWVQVLTKSTHPLSSLKWKVEVFYLNSTLYYGILPVLVF